MSVFRDLLMTMSSDESILPEEYQKVEYIESTGEQYIDTGFIPNQDTRMVADFQYTDVSVGYKFTGTQYQIDKSFRFGSSNAGVYIIRYKDENIRAGVLNANRHLLDFNKNVVYLDNQELYTFTYNTFTGVGNIYIFAINELTLTDLSPARLYSYKLYDNDTLVRNYIPCYRKSDTKPGLYDLVNNVFYTNQGTGEFKIPLPHEYQEVEYIEATGTQYIDTDYYPYKTKSEIKFQKTTLNMSEAEWFLACYNPDNCYYAIGIFVGSKKFVSYNRTNNTYPEIAVGDTNVHTVIYNDEDNNVIFDGDIKVSVSDLTEQGTRKISLFCLGGLTPGNFCTGRIYYVKITDKETGKLVRHMIPCYRKSDNVIGMYDLVNSVFYTNAGSGTFIKGNDV